MEMMPHRRIILPLDVPTKLEAIELVSSLFEHVGLMKVGLQLFTADGPSLCSMGAELGLDVFLDLKLHDIPKTVAGAVRSAAEHKVRFLTVHASGGKAMLEAAALAAPDDMTILAVTVLTSLSAQDLRNMGIDGAGKLSDAELPGRQSLILARTAWESGIRGFVCSPLEVLLLREELGPEAILIVPGVRPAGSDAGDQIRTATPGDAMRAGANFLVIGRPITEAANPVKAARDIAEEIRPYT